jgi:hypothetical protein
VLVDVDLLDDVDAEALLLHLPREVEPHELLVRRMEPEPRKHQVVVILFVSAGTLLDPFQCLRLLHGRLLIRSLFLLRSRAKSLR